MPALSIATSVPVPMAMPTSAAASAGASLTPSPAMATTRPSRRSRATTAAFCSGRNLGFDLVDAEPPRHRLRRGAVVAGQHDDADFFRRDGSQRLGGRRSYRIGDGDDAGRAAVDGEKDRRRAVAAQAFCLASRSSSRCHVRPGIWRCRARSVVARPCRPRPFRSASRSRAHPAIAMPRSAAAATIARASGCSLGCSTAAAGRRTSRLRRGHAWNDGDDLRLAFGQRAGLVDDERVDPLHALQRLGVLDQDAAPRAAPDADHDRHRRGETSAHGHAMISTATRATSA